MNEILLCADINECDVANDCDNDVNATCVNEIGGYTCECAASIDDVIQFDFDIQSCAIPQSLRINGK